MQAESKVRQIIRGVLTLLVFLALLFIPAGRIAWREGWLFLLFFLVTVSGMTLWMRRRDPALAAERTNVAENVEKWDNIIIAIYTVMLFILLILAGLDSGRMNWSTVPLVVRLLGWLGLILAGAIVWWSMASNTFLSERVRIQDDRGHQVVSSGPYKYVRHPMYVGVILSVICVPIVLGSWWALIPGVIIAVLFVVRTVLEDRTLISKLPGYLTYCQEVQYRLIPGVW